MCVCVCYRLCLLVDCAIPSLPTSTVTIKFWTRFFKSWPEKKRLPDCRHRRSFSTRNSNWTTATIAKKRAEPTGTLGPVIAIIPTGESEPELRPTLKSLELKRNFKCKGSSRWTTGAPMLILNSMQRNVLRLEMEMEITD